MSRCTCENCGKSFITEEDWYDLCDECGPIYEQALHEQQQEELASTGSINSFRVPFP